MTQDASPESYYFGAFRRLPKAWGDVLNAYASDVRGFPTTTEKTTSFGWQSLVSLELFVEWLSKHYEVPKPLPPE